MTENIVIKNTANEDASAEGNAASLSHYEGFNVMKEKKHWDSATRNVVEKRLETESFYPFQFLTQQEAKTLFQLCSVLLDDSHYSTLAFVVHHFDKLLSSDIGESQRKIGVPKQTVLIRDGLSLLNETCQQLYNESFENLDEELQKNIVEKLMRGSFLQQSAEKNIPVHALMQKIMTEAVSAYYSHPAVWSEIGYAGPAFPRGYVRTELGLTDPWEAKRKDMKP